MESGTLVSTVVVLGPESVPGGVKLDPERLNGTEREEEELRGGGVTEGEVGGELGVDGDELVVRPEVGVDDSEWLSDARAERDCQTWFRPHSIRYRLRCSIRAS